MPYRTWCSGVLIYRGTWKFSLWAALRQKHIFPMRWFRFRQKNILFGGRAKPCNLCTVCHLNLPTAAEVDFGRFIPRKWHFSDCSINASPICVFASGRSVNEVLWLVKRRISPLNPKVKFDLTVEWNTRYACVKFAFLRCEWNFCCRKSYGKKSLCDF